MLPRTVSPLVGGFVDQLRERANDAPPRIVDILETIFGSPQYA
jgi:hypothetical protein